VKTFDLVLLGSGAGLAVSSAAAEAGMTVAVVDPGPFGGTCLNRGCIPSKMLIRSADLAVQVQRSDILGIHAEIQRVDWQGIIRRVAEAVEEDSAKLEAGNRGASNISVYKEAARFTGPHMLRVGEETIAGERIVIAAGGRPRIPAIEGLADSGFLTSDEALRLPEQPRRLVIIGGGFIGAELAHFFGALGTEVTIVQRASRLLRREDDEVSEAFTEIYSRRHEVALSSNARRVSRTEDGSIAVVAETPDGERTLHGDSLLIATGRVPNTDTLDVASAGIKTNEGGFVETDEYLETNVPGIWALGDIVGRYMLRHSANLEAAYVSHNLLHPAHKQAVDYSGMPHAVFASPQVGAVGLTETEARESGRDFAIGRYRYYDTAYGLSVEDRDGFVKVIADPETEAILGCHILGTEASVLVQEAATLIRAGVPASAISGAIYIHPALTEVVQAAFSAVAATRSVGSP
jgi:dihydrolipoamide dehydrogenase